MSKTKALAAERKQYLEEHSRCVVCGRHGADSVHELIGGCFRQRTVKDKRYWLAAHYIECHVPTLQHDTPRARQWLLKCMFDPENFSVEAMGEIPGRVTTAAEVLEEFRKFYLESL